MIFLRRSRSPKSNLASGPFNGAECRIDYTVSSFDVDTQYYDTDVFGFGFYRRVGSGFIWEIID